MQTTTPAARRQLSSTDTLRDLSTYQLSKHSLVRTILLSAHGTGTESFDTELFHLLDCVFSC